MRWAGQVACNNPEMVGTRWTLLKMRFNGGLCRGGSEPQGSLKAILYNSLFFFIIVKQKWISYDKYFYINWTLIMLFLKLYISNFFYMYTIMFHDMSWSNRSPSGDWFCIFWSDILIPWMLMNYIDYNFKNNKNGMSVRKDKEDKRRKISTSFLSLFLLWKALRCIMHHVKHKGNSKVVDYRFWSRFRKQISL